MFRAAEQTDWERIVLLYDALMHTRHLPSWHLSRAVAVDMAQGPADTIAALAGDSALAGYHLFHSVRGDLLMKMGDFLRRVRKSSGLSP
jgi:predicted RNA polymerase sigma factor